jgi:hypothetical protein
MTEYTIEDEDTRIGNTAPDWGKSYGLTELWTEIKPGLWNGGTADEDTVLQAREGKMSMWSGMVVSDKAEITKDEFDAVVTLYAWARPVDWLVEELRWGIFDGGEAPDIEKVRDAVIWAHKRWKNGEKVLLRCQAGLSRSGLLTALVLVRDGMEVQQAIDTIRRERSGHCLNVNGSSAKGAFTKMLMTTPVEFWREGLEDGD